MAGPVGDIGDERQILAFLTSQKSVDGLDEDFDKVDVLPLIEASDVIGFGYLSLMENEVDGASMVLDVEPIPHILPFPIDGKGLFVAYVVDEQRDEFLGELVGSIVVGAVGDDDGHPIGVMESAHEMVARCLGGAVG